MTTYRIVVEHSIKFNDNNTCQGWFLNMDNGRIEPLYTYNLDKYDYPYSRELPFDSAKKLLDQCYDTSMTWEITYESYHGYIDM